MPEFQHLRPKYLDAKDRSGNPLSYATLRARLETQFQAETISEQRPALASAHAVRLEKQEADLQAAGDEIAALKTQVQTHGKRSGGKRSDTCAWCKERGFNPRHASRKCWRQFPHLRPSEQEDATDAITDSAWCVGHNIYCTNNSYQNTPTVPKLLAQGCPQHFDFF